MSDDAKTPFVPKIEVNKTQVVLIEDGESIIYDTVGSVTLENEEKKSVEYFVNYRDTENDSVEYLITDSQGGPVSDTLQDAVTKLFLDELQKQHAAEEASSAKVIKKGH